MALPPDGKVDGLIVAYRGLFGHAQNFSAWAESPESFAWRGMCRIFVAFRGLGGLIQFCHRQNRNNEAGGRRETKNAPGQGA
jgi:hypothetical protein